MTQTRPSVRPQAPAPAAPARAPRPVPIAPLRPVQAPARLLDPPTWAERLLPRAVRNGMAALGWWQNPVPKPPSIHLVQTLDTLRTYGWCKSLDVSPTGRCCIRGAQSLLQKAGHVTPEGRARAEHYMAQILAQDGVRMPFFAWNDLPSRTFPEVENLLVSAAYRARANGE